MLKFKEVLGYKFINNSMDELVAVLDNKITNSKKTFVVTANPEIITYASTHSSYETVIKGSDYITPDGVGIIMASKILGNPLKERLAGFDLMERLLQLSDKKKLSIYFLGTKPNIIDLTVANIQKKYPHIHIAGFHHGYFKNEEEKIISEIQQQNPDIVFVGLGFPKQEKWISKNIPHFNRGIFIGVGGCLNVWAGVDKRAPKVWRKLNIEWLYRVIQQPSRAKRILAIPVFLNQVLNVKYKTLLRPKNSKELISEMNKKTD